MSRRPPGGGSAPVVDADLYADEALEDPSEVFARIREAGPVVWLLRHRIHAMGRFDDVRAALRDAELWRSGAGVAANPIANALGTDTTLNSDGETHTVRRRVLMTLQVGPVDGDRARGGRAHLLDAGLQQPVEHLLRQL